MRHKYDTRALVLARTHVGEATTLVTILTADLGLVQARAQSLRKPGAKLAPALATFAESELVLVRGREGWRVAGAVLAESWSRRLGDIDARRAAARVSGLLLRLVAGEARDQALYPLLIAFFKELAEGTREYRDAAEIRAVISLLAALGLDAGEPAADLSAIAADRARYIARINAGIAASGL
jgi:DNA repair protein RecO